VLVGPVGENPIRTPANATTDPSATTAAHPEFTPLRRVSRRKRAALLIIGPLLWVGALVAVSYVVRKGDAVGIALLVLAAALLLALAVLVPMRLRRIHDERKP
jgi:hypothetical protein